MTDQPQNLRGLKAAVGIMGVLIIIGTTVVVGTIIHRLYARISAPPPMSVAPLSAPPAPLPPPAPLAATAAELAPGEHISGIAAAGAMVAVWVSGPNGDRLLLVDPASGQVRIGLQGAPAPQK